MRCNGIKRVKSGLQVTEPDGSMVPASSASDHATVLYLDPVHAASRGPPIRPQNHQFYVNMSLATVGSQILTVTVTVPWAVVLAYLWRL